MPETNHTHLPKLRVYDQLSFRLLRWVLLTALVAGVMLSVAQIVLDAARAAKEMDDQAAQILAVMKDPATQAVYSIDPELAEQVVDGLFQQRAVCYAAISHPDNSFLAKRSRPLIENSHRWLTDRIFDQQRQYSIPLTRDEGAATHYGNLIITIDTVEAAQAFLERALVLFVSGLIKAFVLGLMVYAVYHYLLTAPLMSIIRSLLKIDPAAPGEKTISIPTWHERDELGLWVQTANNLLKSIDDNQQQRIAAEARILKMSQYDSLTGLPNRAMFRNHLQASLDDAKRLNQKIALFCIGIDDFKSVNEQYSYNQGDRLLQSFAERLAGHGEVLHTVSRLSGDQFALILYNVGGAYRAATFAEDLLKSLNQAFRIDQHQVHLHATVGIALYPDDGEDADKLLQKAEQTMMLAKSSNRNQFQFYVASVDSELRERKQLEKDLASALANKEFHLVYQPQIDMVEGRIIGAEALIRWKHPTRGFVPPDVFIPIAESNDSIKEIGAWVIHEACAQLKKWSACGIDLCISINLSAVQLRQRGIVELIRNSIRENGIKPDQLEMEITETSFMENLGDAVDTLNAIRQFGVGCAVDDFGTGYSSLSYLKRLPIDKIKIDKQFIRDLMLDEDDTSIVNAIIQLGRSLKLKVIAEGVETAEQVTYLTANGCYEAQGYYYSEPLPAEDFVGFVHSYKQTGS